MLAGIYLYMPRAGRTAHPGYPPAARGSSQPQQPDPRLKVFHILSARIITQDNQAEVDGTIQNTGHDPFPYDVTINATFYDISGDVIGQAQGVAEDVFPGTIGAFVLVGQVDSVRYSSYATDTLVSYASGVWSISRPLLRCRHE